MHSYLLKKMGQNHIYSGLFEARALKKILTRWHSHMKMAPKISKAAYIDRAVYIMFDSIVANICHCSDTVNSRIHQYRLHSFCRCSPHCNCTGKSNIRIIIELFKDRERRKKNSNREPNSLDSR